LVIVVSVVSGNLARIIFWSGGSEMKPESHATLPSVPPQRPWDDRLEPEHRSRFGESLKILEREFASTLPPRISDQALPNLT
jgi:hypothetical protein